MNYFNKTSHGSIILNTEAYEKFLWWEKKIQANFRSFFQQEIHIPSLISKKQTDITSYATLFPQHLFTVQSFLNTSAELNLFLAPAVCHTVFQQFQNTCISDPTIYFAHGRCFRHEDSLYNPPFRLAEFTMHELIAIGNESFISTFSKKLLNHTQLFLKKYLPITIQDATDSFYMGDQEGAQLIQKMKKLKKEFVVRIDKSDIAVASLNIHEDHFTKLFSITSSQKEPLYSLCLAFGIERLTFASLVKQ